MGGYHDVPLVPAVHVSEEPADVDVIATGVNLLKQGFREVRGRGRRGGGGGWKGGCG